MANEASTKWPKKSVFSLVENKKKEKKMSTLKDFVESFIDSFHYRFKFSTATER